MMEAARTSETSVDNHFTRQYNPEDSSEHHNPNPPLTKVHQTNLNLNNFKLIEAKGLKILHRDPLEWHYFRTKFHENLPSGSKVISGGRTDRHRQPFWNDRGHL
jgi:hypothetical protein